jgi:hypothetical protein
MKRYTLEDHEAYRKEQDVMLYERLVLLALAESALARQQQTGSATKARKAS